MAEACSHASLLVRARESGPGIGCSEEHGVFLCFGWCCVPLWAHSTSTCTFACTRRPGCAECVLPRPGARERAAIASRGGLASERVLGECAVVCHTIVFWGEFFMRQHARRRVAFM